MSMPEKTRKQLESELAALKSQLADAEAQKKDLLSETYQSLLDTLPTPVVISRLPDGPVLYTNRSLKRFLALEDHMLPSLTTTDIYQCLPNLDHVLNLLDEQENLPNLGCCGQRFDGQEFCALVDLQKSTSQGQPVVMGTFHDITVMKMLETELSNTNRLLEAISQAQTLFITGSDPVVFFRGLLQELVELTGSEFGGIGNVKAPSEGDPVFKLYAVVDTSPDSSLQQQLLSLMPDATIPTPITNLLGKTIREGKPVIVNDFQGRDLPPPMMQIGLHLKAFLGLPLISGEQVVGMAGLANRPGGYTQELVDYLEPFLFAAANLITALEEKRQRAQAEAALRESHEKWRALVENIPDVVTMIDREGNILFSNRLEAHQITALKPTIFDYLAPETAPETRRLLDQVFATGETRSLEVALGGVGAYTVHYHNRLSPILRGGEVVAVNIISTDITEQRQAEEALKESEARLDLALQGAGLGTWNWNIGTGGLIFNDRWAEMLGYTIDELDPHFDTWSRLIHPDDLPVVIQASTRHAQGHIPYFEAMHRLRAKSGEWRWILSRGKVVEWDMDGAPSRMAGTHLDVTERRETEEALKESEQRYRILVETSPVAIIVHQEGKLVYANPAATRLGNPEKPVELVGRPFSQFVHPDYSKSVEERISNTVSSGDYQPPVMEKLVLLDGTVIDVQVSGVLTTFEGKPAVQVVILDMTERLQAEEREREQRRLAESLRDTATALSSTLDLDEVFDRILVNARRVIDHDAAIIALVEGETVRAVRHRVYLPPELDYEVSSDPYPLNRFPATQQVMLETHRPVIIPDVRQSPEWVRIETNAWIGSYAGAPILLGDRVVGFISFVSGETGFYTEQHIERLQTFASQAALAIHNAQLFEEVQHHVGELEKLNRFMREITAELDLETVLKTITRNVLDLLDTAGGGIYLYRPEKDNLEWVVSEGTGLAPPGARLERGEGLSGKVWERGEPMLVNNYARWEGRAAIYEEYDWKSVLAVPIYWRDEFLGVINATTSAEQGVRSFSDHDKYLLEISATQAAIAIHNASLYEEVRMHARELEALRQATLNVTRQLDLDTLLGELVEDAISLLEADTGGIYLYRPDEDCLERVVSSAASPIATNVKLVKGEGLSGKVWESGKPLIVADYEAWTGRADKLETATARSVIGMPIHWRDEFLGVLNVAMHGDDRRIFTENDKNLLSLFTDQAAVAIKNAHLYGESQKRNQRLMLLNEIIRSSTTIFDRRRLLRTLADKAGGIIGGDGCYITVWDPKQKLAQPGAAYGDVHKNYMSDRPSSDEKTLTQSVLEVGRPLAVSDVFDTPYLSQSIAERYPARSILALPLVVGDLELGALLIAFNSQHTFTQDEIAWAEQASELIALALARAKVYADMEQLVDARTAELREAHEKMVVLAQVKDDFIASISHELRTPITNLKLYHHLLSLRPDKLDDYRPILERETKRLGFIVEELLSASETVRLPGELNLRLVDFNPLVARLLENYGQLAESRSLSIQFEYVDETARIELDPNLFDRALGALLKNAINYSEPGGEIRVCTARGPVGDRDGIFLRVTDSGVGIPEEERPRLFNQFFRGEAALKVGIPGTGMGLYTARQIAEQHGGTLELATGDADQSSGATFVLWPPARASKDKADSTA